MRAAAVNFLVHKTHLKQKALTLRIPLHVHEALNAIRERADSAGFVFDTQVVVVEALERALERVAHELQGIEAGKLDSPITNIVKRSRARRTPPDAAESLK